MRQGAPSAGPQLGTVKMALQNEGNSGKLVAEFNQVCFPYGDKPLIDRYSGVITRGR